MIQPVRLSGPTLKVLKLLLTAPQERRSGAAISKETRVGSGTLYPLLQRLEIAHWIEGHWEDVDPSKVGRPKRRLYRLTPDGYVEAQRAFAEFQVSMERAPSWT